MYVAFLVLVPACVVKYGGWSWLRRHVPPGHLTWDGGLGWQAVAVWYVIAMSTLVEPAFYQRCYCGGVGADRARWASASPSASGSSSTS